MLPSPVFGKTALAVHAAHRLAGHHPDGQLFIDLHGHTRGGAPIEPGQALDHLLRTLGVPGPQIPAGVEQRAALYRSRLAGQRMLIVLDNASTETQVEPLLPGSAGCLVIITSRRRLTGLDHTHTLSLDTLPVGDAVELFVRTVGRDRLAGQPVERVAELVELCGRLPLAIRIAAARLRAHPTWQPADLAARLGDRRHRLGQLQAGQRSVTAALDLSYQHLTSEQQRAYRALGWHPGSDVDAHATAALLDSAVAHAGRMLDQLHEMHLLQEPVPDRYRFHDLTRAHAASGEVEGADAALRRLLDYYCGSAAAAMDAAYPYEREYRPQVPSNREFADAGSALSWLDAELSNVLAAARCAAERGWREYVLQLSNLLRQDLAVRGRFHEAETLHGQALALGDGAESLVGLGNVHMRQGRHEQAEHHYREALALARDIGHPPGEMEALTGLGHILLRQGSYEPAIQHLEGALHIARTIGHRAGTLEPLTGLGHLYWRQGRHEEADHHYGQALHIAGDIGHRQGKLNALSGLGNVQLRQGRDEIAARYFEEALQIAGTTGNLHGELNALTGLSRIHWRQGRHEQAARHLERALQIAQTIGHRQGELNALTGLGHVHRLGGRHDDAMGHYRRLYELARASGDHNFEFEATQGMGRLSTAGGEPAAAIGQHVRALELARELRQPPDEARAHDGLAHAYLAMDQPEKARHHWQTALDILAGIGADHTDDEETNVASIRARLS